MLCVLCAKKNIKAICPLNGFIKYLFYDCKSTQRGRTTKLFYPIYGSLFKINAQIASQANKKRRGRTIFAHSLNL